MTEAGVLLEAMDRIERSGAEFAVSFFASASKIEAWSAEGVLSILPCEGALLILRHDGPLLRVSHLASDQPSLSAALGKLIAMMPDQLMVADLVGKPGDIERVAQAYRRHGFAPYAQLVRMQRMGVPTMTADGVMGVELARAEDVPTLHAFMQRWLDPLSEQIQGVRELQEAVAASAVFVVRAGCELAGFLILEATGQSAVLRYWHVAGHCHGQGIGSRLMHAFFGRCASSRRVTLWVVADNVDAIAKYHHYGFSEDGMIDSIMVRRAETATR
ncbi:GNAT family N-acetyltransferase [Rhodanobacter hydrolyticus]|uniref:GNAT family N-acetyltransferase n=1 Tax=Rhodanobacter hydrolyticus TaxID=2250595 RepID=A0ABW8J8D6_9GAMM